MNLVIDANVLFSALAKDSHIRHFLLLGNISLYAPEFIHEELLEHIKELIKKTELSKEEIEILIKQIIVNSDIDLIPFEYFKNKAVEAEKISPDPDDIQYFALALKLNCPIWSNDKKLKEQNKIKILNNKEVMEALKNET